MTAGIEGSGPYGKLRDLKTQKKQYQYEITMLSPSPRRLVCLKGLLNEVNKRMAVINAEIKADRAQNLRGAATGAT